MRNESSTHFKSPRWQSTSIVQVEVQNFLDVELKKKVLTKVWKINFLLAFFWESFLMETIQKSVNGGRNTSNVSKLYNFTMKVPYY